MKAKFRISDEMFYNNGKIILNSIPDIKKSITDMLSKKVELKTIQRTPKGKKAYTGIKADSLNKALRECMNSSVINGETHVENGVFFHTSKEGFDFSVYDKTYNMARLYNYYLGAIGVLNGDKKIINQYKKLGIKKSEWRGKIDALSAAVEENTDYIVEKESLTVAGEFQFGNWALIYRDLFRLLNADSNPGIDFYIYVAADDELSKLLSANTVSYRQAKEVITENLSIIKIPIWLIALGVEEL